MRRGKKLTVSLAAATNSVSPSSMPPAWKSKYKIVEEGGTRKFPSVDFFDRSDEKDHDLIFDFLKDDTTSTFSVRSEEFTNKPIPREPFLVFGKPKRFDFFKDFHRGESKEKFGALKIKWKFNIRYERFNFFKKQYIWCQSAIWLLELKNQQMIFLFSFSIKD